MWHLASPPPPQMWHLASSPLPHLASPPPPRMWHLASLPPLLQDLATWCHHHLVGHFLLLLLPCLAFSLEHVYKFHRIGLTDKDAFCYHFPRVGSMYGYPWLHEVWDHGEAYTPHVCK
ncbi:hypothetical protein QOT17_019013 [Balamuthia mandrillaris]